MTLTSDRGLRLILPTSNKRPACKVTDCVALMYPTAEYVTCYVCGVRLLPLNLPSAAVSNTVTEVEFIVTTALSIGSPEALSSRRPEKLASVGLTGGGAVLARWSACNARAVV